MKRNDYTIYHVAHGEYLQKHSLKCRLLPDENVCLFDGSEYFSFSQTINTCVANCPTEIVIIFSHKVYPFPEEIQKILQLIDEGYAFVGLYRFAFFAFKKDLFRKIGFLDERFTPGGYEDLDFLIRLKEANFSMYVSEEAVYGTEESAWRKNRPRIHAAMLHFRRKWGVLYHEFKKESYYFKRNPKESRRLAEELYTYDLGPSINAKFLPWLRSRLNPMSFDKFNNVENVEYSIQNPIYRRKYSLKRLWHIRNYSCLNQFLNINHQLHEINQIPNIKNLSYLEIGMGDRHNYINVKTKRKLYVDISKHNVQKITKRRSFDIIFINGSIGFDLVSTHLINLFSSCTKFIVISCMYPEHIRLINSSRCNDAYKILYTLLNENKLEMMTLNYNNGLTFIKATNTLLNITDKNKNLSYINFKDYMKSQNLYSCPEVVKVLTKWTEIRNSEYTIYHVAHDEYLQKHSLKCRLLPDETVHLFDGTGYPSFSKVVNTCVANCPTEIVIIFSHKVYPFPEDIQKILKYLELGYAFVALYRFAFFAFKKDLFRKIGFLDERYANVGYEDIDFYLRLREANFGIYVSHEAFYGYEKSSWNGTNKRPNFFTEKWKITNNRNERRRTITEENYDYDLGPSTNEKYLSWNSTLLNTFSSLEDILPKETSPLNIYDKRLANFPHNKNRNITRFTDYNNCFKTARCSVEINQLSDIENFSYLELGIGDKNNFNAVKCKNKKSVDISSVYNPTYVMTTDNYFKNVINEKFDIIFIDANHTFDYALRDLNNSFLHCNHFVMIHAMIPPIKKHTHKTRCGDSYKILMYLLKETNLEVVVLNDNFGLTFIKMPAHEIVIPDSYKNATFEDFKSFIDNQPTYSTPEIVKILKKWTT